MLRDLELLLDVQELDKEQITLNEQLALYPRIWEEVKKKLADARTSLTTAETEKENHLKERKRLEMKIRLLSEDLRKFQIQQNAIKTAKEYEAINKQIEGVKTKITATEEQALALIARDEAVAQAIVDAKKAIAKFEETYTKEKERIRVQFNEKKARVAKIDIEKKRIIERVDGEVYAAYERINRRHPGSAVMNVRTSSCQGCHFSLLPNVLVQLHRAERTVTCPNCDRLLAKDEDHVPGAVGAAH